MSHSHPDCSTEVPFDKCKPNNLATLKVMAPPIPARRLGLKELGCRGTPEDYIYKTYEAFMLPGDTQQKVGMVRDLQD